MLLCLLALLATPTVVAEPGYLAYGDMRGYLEPCGCDPATDLGGILRINSQIRRERLSHPDVLVFDLGNNVSGKDRDSVKNRYLLRAAAATQPTAYLVNELEMLHLKEFRNLGIPFLLSNNRGKAGIQSNVETASAIIFGYTWFDSVSRNVSRLTPDMLKSWKSVITAKSKPAILLFSGPDQDLHKIAKAGLFTSIITSNKMPLNEDPGKEESQNENLLVRMAEPLIFMVPSGGQGLLRGGALTAAEAKTLDAYLQTPGKTCKEDGTRDPASGCDIHATGLFGKRPIRFTWLIKKTESGNELSDLYREYGQAVAKAFREQGKNRLAALKTSPFAGNQACLSCHPGQHAVYEKSRHARAMQTLVAKGKHEDAECVGCHSVGADVPGGFVSVADSAHLANVQCENCHGARKEHVSNPTVKPMNLKKGEAICATCHNRQHSPGFGFAAYWEKIKH